MGKSALAKAEMQFQRPLVAQPYNQRLQSRDLAIGQAISNHVRHLLRRDAELVVIVHFGLFKVPLQPDVVEGGGIGRHLGAGQIACNAEVEFQVLLERGRIDDIGRTQLDHVADAPDSTRHARLTAKEVSAPPK